MYHSLNTQRLVLRQTSIEDVDLLQEFYKRNATHLAAWETTSDLMPPSSPHIFYTRLQQWSKEWEQGAAIRFFLFTKENSDHLIGMCNFSNIIYGYFYACYLGYKMDHAFQGKGFMQEALYSAIQYVFEERCLHRVMANYMPHNIRSAALLSKMEFQIEGYAPNYLMINGRWEDHVLTALSFEKWCMTKKLIY